MAKLDSTIVYGALTVVDSIRALASPGTSPFVINSSTLVSSLNADFLRGYASSSTNVASTLVLRDANSDVLTRYVSMDHTTSSRTSDTIFYSSTDTYVRRNDATGIKTSLSLQNVTNESKSTMFTNPTFTGNVQLPTGTTKVGNTAISQGGTVTVTLPTVGGTLVGSGDTGTVTNTMLAGSIAITKLANYTISGVNLGSNLNSVTFNNGGAGAVSGSTYNGSAALTVSYNTVGAAASGHTHSGVYLPVGGKAADSELFDGMDSTKFIWGLTDSGTRGALATWSSSEYSQWHSGFWDANGASWTPTTDWWWGLTSAHSSNTSSYNYSGQLIFNLAGTESYFRSISGGTANAWRRIWHEGNFTPANYAPLNSPSFTGTPIAPTAAVDTNTTQLATTAYVMNQGYLKSSSYSASDVLTKLKTVDGAGSGLSADILQSGSTTDLNAAWTDEGTSIANGLQIYRYDATATNKPVSYNNANWLLNLYSHPSGTVSSYGHQLTGPNTEDIYYRRVVDGSFGSWRKIWSESNLTNLNQLINGPGYVPSSRTLTINGTAYDLSTNRSWSVGTVTAVNSGNGMNFSNFTTSGTVTLGTPSSCSPSSSNAVTTNSHTHTVDLNMTASLSSNQTYLGTYENDVVGENVAFGDVLYLKFSDGKWWKARADSYTTTPAARMALATITANNSGPLLIEGNVRNDSWSFAANKVYLSAATAGAMTTTQPSTTGNQLQVLGVAKTSTKMYFKPQSDVGEK